MNTEELIIDVDDAGPRPQRTRKRAEERRIFIYRMIDNKPKEQGSFPETTIGAPLERRLPMFLKDMFGTGEYRVETRKPNGHFEQSFDFSITEGSGETQPAPQQAVIDIQPEPVREELGELSFEHNTGQMSAAEVENLLLKERLRRMEEDLSRNRTGNQTEMQTLISALEESRREQRELMMMMLNRSSQPQADTSDQAMKMLERSMGIVAKVRAISEEIGNPEGSASGGGILADGAKLIDSLGRNAGTFLPMIMGASNSFMSKQPIPPLARPANPAPASAVDSNPPSSGDLAELAKKLQRKEANKESNEGGKEK